MQGTINFDGTLSGSIAGGGGGGSEVSITPIVTTGTKIADFEIDGNTGSLYSPTPESLPGTIVTKALRKYNDTTQTKIMTVTTLDTSNNQEVSQDIYAPSPVQCWYTPGLEQDYQIGQFTYGGVTQNVYIPYFQRPLTAGSGINIDVDNVISCTASGGVNYSTTEQDTGLKWIDNRPIYQRTLVYNPNLNTNSYITIDNTITTSYADHVMVKDMDWRYSDYIVAGQNTGSGGINVTITSGGVSLENMSGATAHDFYITLLYTKVSDL